MDLTRLQKLQWELARMIAINNGYFEPTERELHHAQRMITYHGEDVMRRRLARYHEILFNRDDPATLFPFDRRVGHR